MTYMAISCTISNRVKFFFNKLVAFLPHLGQAKPVRMLFCIVDKGMLN